MTFDQFLQTTAADNPDVESMTAGGPTSVDLARAAAVEVDRDLYLEADTRGLSLSELLETDDFDPSPSGSPLDAFDRQLALAGVHLNGKNPTTVEQFFQKAAVLMPEFMMREIKRGQAMRPELARLIANTTTVSSNRYTPFHVDTSNNARLSLRPIGESAEVPQLLVNEQTNAVTVPDYGLALKASYKALRYRSTSQFRVLLWYIGFRMQTDKIAMLVKTILDGDGNDNAAAVINAGTSGVLDYDDLVTLWSSFAPFEMNCMICHVDALRTILTLEEFKTPLAGYRFQNDGELFSPLGAALVRSDEMPADRVIGLDTRFAVEEVVTQPLMVEYDKIIDQRLEEAVITESVTYAKVIQEASVVLDYDFA
ncbi:MAG: hypothetical protein KKA42_14105 [candidate division Zixibacteria bacterium]|nr:hypothetical protein [candidate division Zixibacteria bacterium]